MLDPDRERFRLQEVVLVPHDLHWQGAFINETVRLKSILGDAVVEIKHVGSTSIPGIVAKPIVDVLIEVRDIVLVDERSPAMKAAGYIGWGENGIPGRRYFIRNEGDVRKNNIHIFQSGNPEIDRMLTFRNYVSTHPEAAQAYEQLKHEVAR